jgi:hypothetical protein
MYITEDFPQQTIRDWFETAGPESLDLVELTNKTSFGEGDHTGEQTSVDYAYSAYLVRYIAEMYGKDRFLAFYDSFAAVPYAEIRNALPRSGGGSIFNTSMEQIAQQVTPELVQTEFGVDLATLERDFETWLGQQLSE